MNALHEPLLELMQFKVTLPRSATVRAYSLTPLQPLPQLDEFKTARKGTLS
jgi:hypothetical protein